MKHSRIFERLSNYKWFIPITYTIIWLFGLYVTLSIRGFLLNYSNIEETNIDIAASTISIFAIFVVFFLELIVMLTNIYITHKANSLAPKFLLIIGFILFLVIVLVITLVLMSILSTSQKSFFLYVLLVVSPLLKLTSSFIEENQAWFIDTEKNIINGRKTPIVREIESVKA